MLVELTPVQVLDLLLYIEKTQDENLLNLRDELRSKLIVLMTTPQFEAWQKNMKKKILKKACTHEAEETDTSNPTQVDYEDGRAEVSDKHIFTKPPYLYNHDATPRPAKIPDPRIDVNRD